MGRLFPLVGYWPSMSKMFMKSREIILAHYATKLFLKLEVWKAISITCIKASKIRNVNFVKWNLHLLLISEFISKENMIPNQEKFLNAHCVKRNSKIVSISNYTKKHVSKSYWKYKLELLLSDFLRKWQTFLNRNLVIEQNKNLTD